jgi:spore coat protein U-like protein
MNRIKILALLLSSFFIAQARAQTTTTTPMNVSATVASSCTITANPLVFGNINLSQPASYSQTQMSFNCTKNTSYTIKIDGGLYSSGSNRYMKNSANNDLLSYELQGSFDTSINAVMLSGTATGNSMSYVIFSRIVGGQVVSAGNYSDIVTFSITY